MSLLSLCQDAAALVGLDRPSEILSSNDPTFLQLASLAQVEGDELSRMHDWRGLKVRMTLTGDGTSTLFDLPCDWDRWMVGGEALWETDRPDYPLYGPISDEDMVRYQAGAATPPQPVWRMIGDQVEFYPAPGSGVIVKSLYMTSHWITNAAGDERQPRWLLDSDVATVPERIVTLGLVWRWKRAKGLDYAEEYRTHQRERVQASTRNGGVRMLTLASNFGHRSIADRRRNAYSVAV